MTSDVTIHVGIVRISVSGASVFVLKVSIAVILASSEQSIVTFPENHSYILHTTHSSYTTDGQLVSEMTMIVCKNEKNRPYVIFQNYKLQKNRLANVAFFVSSEDCSVEGPVCADDVPGQLFIEQLKGSVFNVQLVLQETLKRRGFVKLDSLVRYV